MHAACGGNPFLTGALLDELASAGHNVGAAVDGRGHRRPRPGHDLAGDAEPALRAGPRRSPAPPPCSACTPARGWPGRSPASTPTSCRSPSTRWCARNVLVGGVDGLTFVHPVIREATLARSARCRRPRCTGARSPSCMPGTRRRASSRRTCSRPRSAPCPTPPTCSSTRPRESAAAGDHEVAAACLERALTERPGDLVARAAARRHPAASRAARRGPAHLLAAAEAADDVRRHGRAARRGQHRDPPAGRTRSSGRRAGRRRSSAWPPRERRAGAAGARGPAGRAALVRARAAPGRRRAPPASSPTWPEPRPRSGPCSRCSASAAATTATRTRRSPTTPAGAGRRRALRRRREGDGLVSWVLAMMSLITAEGVEEGRAEIGRARLRVNRGGSPVDYAMVAQRQHAAGLAHRRRHRHRDRRRVDPGRHPARAARTRGGLAARDRHQLRLLHRHGAARPRRREAAAGGVRRRARRGHPRGADDLAARGPRRGSPWPTTTRTAPCGTSTTLRRELDDAGVDPASLAWRLPAAIAYSRIGDEEKAQRALAEHVDLARRWGAPTDLGAALRVAARFEPDAERARRAAGRGGGRARAVARPARARQGAGRPGRDLAGARPAYRCAGGAHQRRATWPPPAVPRRCRTGSPRPSARSVTGPRRVVALGRRVADRQRAPGGQPGHLGRSNRDIAQELFVSPKTVENHLGRVYTKLGIGNRRELAGALG